MTDEETEARDHIITCQGRPWFEFRAQSPNHSLAPARLQLVLGSSPHFVHPDSPHEAAHTEAGNAYATGEWNLGILLTRLSLGGHGRHERSSKNAESPASRTFCHCLPHLGEGCFWKGPRFLTDSLGCPCKIGGQACGCLWTRPCERERTPGKTTGQGNVLSLCSK